MGGLPDGWMKYKPMGKVIPGTRFIAFKVPLKETLCSNLQKNERFTPHDVIEGKPNISLIVDLTNTTRYYDKNVFESANKSYVKIFCPGHVIPTKKIVSQFFESVDKFLKEHPDDESLIGVHCTHGVNRTGYFICKYMIDKMDIEPSHAIEVVGRARGYPIERINYLQDLKGEETTEEPTPAKRENKERENLREPVRRNYVERERSYNDRNTYNDRTKWRKDDRRDNRRDGRYNPYGDRPKFGRQGRYFQRGPRRFRGHDSGRSQNWNGRARAPYEQGSSRDYSSDRYNQNDRSRNRARYGERPNRGPR